MKKAYLFITLLCLMSYGCEKNISLDIPKYNDQLVVYCVMPVNYYPYLYLSRSQSYYSYADTDTTLTNTIIQNAQVIITDLTINKTNVLSYDTFSQAYFAGVKGFTGVPGHHYALKINYQGKALTAETTVPMEARIDHVDYVKLDSVPGQWVNYEFHVFFKSVAGGPNYYSLNDETFISDDGVAGKQFEIIASYRKIPMASDSVYFQLNTANRETANYFSNINIQSQNAGDPFSQPAIVEGNINGGLGIFGSIATGGTFMVIIK